MQAMSLSEALAEGAPHPPVRRAAYKGRSYKVAYDGQCWDLHYYGSPFWFDTQDDLEMVLMQHGISLLDGWQPSP